MDILDASALLAFIKQEKGGETIKKLLATSKQRITSVFMHAVNYSEFIYKCEKLFGHKKTLQIIADLETPFFGVMNYFENDLTLFSAYLKSNYHLSLADAIGLAHTKIMKSVFWTADKALIPIAQKENISLKCIR